MSTDEMKIREEMEKDEEGGQEEEIKDAICRLALRLNRLYQKQKERNETTEVFNVGIKDQVQGTNNKLHTELNINIKMEGGTKIEIKEIKKQAEDSRARIRRTESAKGMTGSSGKKFDWVKSLRSGECSMSVDTKDDSSRQSKSLGNTAKVPPNASPQHTVKEKFLSRFARGK